MYVCMYVCIDADIYLHIPFISRRGKVSGRQGRADSRGCAWACVGAGVGVGVGVCCRACPAVRVCDRARLIYIASKRSARPCWKQQAHRLPMRLPCSCVSPCASPQLLMFQTSAEDDQQTHQPCCVSPCASPLRMWPLRGAHSPSPSLSLHTTCASPLRVWPLSGAPARHQPTNHWGSIVSSEQRTRALLESIKMMCLSRRQYR